MEIKHPIIDAAIHFFELRKKELTEPAENVASHRRLYLSVEQFEAFVKLKLAVDEMTLTDEDELGIEAIIYLQRAMGIEETREEALIGWRQMSPANRKTTMVAYNAVKAQEEAHVKAKR